MSLPPDFAELRPFEEKWALATEAERQGARLAADMADIEAFYAAVQARIDAQLGNSERVALADVVIDNGGTEAELLAKLDAEWKRLRQPPLEAAS